MELLAFLASVAARLPWEHRAGVAGRFGGAARLRQASVAVQQQRPGDGGQPQVQYREDEQVVPEDVAAVRLTVQPAGRCPAVEIRTVVGHRLQQMQQMQPQDAQFVGVALEFDGQPLPQLRPAASVSAEQLAEMAESAQRALGVYGGLEDRDV